MPPAPPSPTPAPGRPRFWRLAALLGVLVALLGLYLQRPRPGRSVLTYRIGAVDPRFGLSREEVAGAAASAVGLWREPVGRGLFREDPRGDIEITLVYDQRQETLDRLKALNQGIAKAGGPIEELKARFEGLRAAYERRREGLEADLADHNRRVAAFNAENAALRRRGDATENEVRRLGSERDALNTALEGLRRRERELEASRGEVKAAVEEVNRQVEGRNAQVVTYQDTGNLLKEEFDEGVYAKRLGRQTITIYCYSSRKALVRVLAHELGHALGFGHAGDPKAIMYPMMLTDSWELAPEDLTAIKALCGVS